MHAEAGICYVFKDEVAGQQFLAGLHRRAAAGPRRESRKYDSRKTAGPSIP
jgi:hypothetical protein